MRWLAAHTWLIVLVPLVTIILLSHHLGKPLQLLKDTNTAYLDQDTLLAMRLLSEGQQRTKTIKYEAEVEDGSKILLYLQRDSLLMPTEGDVLLVRSTIRRGGRLGDFDYGLYLRRQGIVGTSWAHRGNWQLVGRQPNHSIRNIAQRCQRRLYRQYQRMGVHGKELEILSALTLGYRENLDTDVQRAFSASGAMHVLAVSGLHTGIVWGIVIWILTLGGWRKPLYEERWKQAVLSIIVISLLWVYAFITGLSPSIMRSALMLTFWEISRLFRQHTSNWNPLLAAAVIILIINPLALWSISFQLSFAAVIGIMYIGKQLQQHVVLRNKTLSYLGGLLLVSLAAQIGTMPLTLHYFEQTSNYFALTNLIVIPLAFVLLLLGFGTLAFSWCFLGEWLGVAAQWCTYCMRKAVEWIESLPYSTTQMHLSEWGAIGLYCAIICAAMMMRKEKVKWVWLLGVIGCLAAVLWIELNFKV
jgi:competence protein ComEC